jgi:hypothetical protein
MPLHFRDTHRPSFFFWIGPVNKTRAGTKIQSFRAGRCGLLYFVDYLRTWPYIFEMD